SPHEAVASVKKVFQEYGLPAQESMQVAESLSKHPDAWVDFMMRFELGLEEPAPKRALTSAGTIAGAYILGGFIPVSPCVMLGNAHRGLMFSAVITLVALGIFGFIKGRFTGTNAV